MSHEEKRRLLIAFDALVRSKAKGTAEDFAHRLGVSRMFFRLVKYMREELQVPIIYEDAEKRYIYEREGALVFGFVSFDLVDKEDLKKINGGENLTWHSKNILPGVNWRD